MFLKKMFRYVTYELWIFYFFTLGFAITFNVLKYFYKSRPSPCNCLECDNIHNKTYNDFDDMTYISVPRNIKNNKDYLKIKLAISSWLSSSPKSKVILFVNRSKFHSSLPYELDQLYGKGRVFYANELRSDIKGVPYLDQWFEKGINLCETKYVTFINTDILLSSKWFHVVQNIFKIFEKFLTDQKPFIIGQRIDFDLVLQNVQTIHYGQNILLKEIDEMILNSSHSLHSIYGMDTFSFRADDPPFPVSKFPPYLIGRYNWDNWFVGWLNRIADTISLLDTVPVYHINHRRHDFNINNSRIAINHYIKKANNDYFGFNGNTKWFVDKNYLKLRSSSVKYPLNVSY